MSTHSTVLSNRLLTIFFMLIVAALGAGCASQPRLADYCTPLSQDVAAKIDKDRKGLAEKHNVYAVLSNNVYKPAGHPEIWVDPNEWEARCEDIPPEKRPTNAYNSLDCDPDRPGKGLEAKTYLRWPQGINNGQPTELVFVFRGTTSLSDWWCGNISDCQYSEADDYVKSQIKKYRDKYPGIAIVSTGHSLGGGLAQHIAFCVEGARAVGFNTSPRSHKHDCKALEEFRREAKGGWEEDVKKNHIVRIHQHAEILSPIRHLFSSSDYKDTAYNFTTAGFLARHGMTPLAMGLTKVAACPIQNGPDSSSAPEQSDAQKVLAQTCNKVPMQFHCVQ